MITYLSNLIQDIYYGYVNVKCVNKSCSRVFKMSRNTLNQNNINNYSCNMGCALNYFNDINEQIKENQISNKTDVEQEVQDQNSTQEEVNYPVQAHDAAL